MNNRRKLCQVLLACYLVALAFSLMGCSSKINRPKQSALWQQIR
jgi:hypothetical protein